MSIPARRKVRGLLEGEYTSTFHGRSPDFDDVRPYVPGDSLADIDWKSTARVGAPMTRRHIASRKHNVLIVADTGRTMAALAGSGERKIDIAITISGMLAYVATRHGDLVGLVAGDSAETVSRRPASTEAHLERLLQVMSTRTTSDSALSGFGKSLDFVARAYRRRLILLIISDDRPPGPAELSTLRRLAVQHELLWITIGDADPTQEDWRSGEVFDVVGADLIPSALRSNRRVREEFARATFNAIRDRAVLLESLQIAGERLDDSGDALPTLVRLLAAHRSTVRRR